MRRPMDLDEYVLRHVFGLRQIPQHAINQIHHRLLVFIYQFGKSSTVALFNAQHQGGIRISFGPHLLQICN